MDMTTVGDTGLLEALQHEVAVFARRAEQTRLGGVGQVRNSMDRAAYLLLNRLDKEGPMGVKALAASMGIDSSTVTRQVAPLVDTGLVKRTSHPEDGRAVVLQLSPRGQSRLDEVRASRRQLMAELTHEWAPEEREVFCALLTRFNGALSARQATQGMPAAGVRAGLLNRPRGGPRSAPGAPVPPPPRTRAACVRAELLTGRPHLASYETGSSSYGVLRVARGRGPFLRGRPQGVALGREAWCEKDVPPRASAVPGSSRRSWRAPQDGCCTPPRCSPRSPWTPTRARDGC